MDSSICKMQRTRVHVLISKFTCLLPTAVPVHSERDPQQVFRDALHPRLPLWPSLGTGKARHMLAVLGSGRKRRTQPLRAPMFQAC